MNPISGVEPTAFRPAMHQPNKSDGAINLAQFFPKPSAWNSYEMLMLAILEQAIKDNDKDWFTDEDRIVSFEDVCAVLHLSASAARKAILAGLPAPKAKANTKRKLDLIITDTPGHSYTHAYGQCGLVRTCSQCMQRYQYCYRHGGAKFRGNWKGEHEQIIS